MYLWPYSTKNEMAAILTMHNYQPSQISNKQDFRHSNTTETQLTGIDESTNEAGSRP